MPETMELWNNRFGETEFRPYLTPYLLPGEPVRPAIIVLPGGGYCKRAAHEGEPVAKRFNELGFHAFVLEYRVAPAVYPAPQEDALRAVRLVRYHAGAWHIRPDRIAILGFSAGGHLACSAGLWFDRIPAEAHDSADSVSARPDAVILGYPVITAFPPYAHHDSFVKLLGHEFSTEEAEQFSLEKHARPDMPPVFLWHCTGDTLVPCENSILFARAIRAQKIPFSLHIFPQGRHGIDLGDDTSPAVKAWPELCRDFLNNL